MLSDAIKQLVIQTEVSRTHAALDLPVFRLEQTVQGRRATLGCARQRGSVAPDE